MIPGLDVFSGYGVIDWSEVAAAGYRFAFIKTGEGNEPARDDILFRDNVEEARKAGLYVGGYFFPYPLEPDGKHTGRSPEEQAERAWALSGGLGTRRGELPHVVDAEWPEIGDWGRWGCSATQISHWLRRYCECVSEKWNRRPIIYTYPFWWRALAASADVSWAEEYPLWIASYLHPWDGMPPMTLNPLMPATWKRWAFWQHSAKGSPVRIPGVKACPVDRDVFNGDLDDLRRLALIDPDASTLPEIRLDLLETEPPPAIVYALPDPPDRDPPPSAA